MMHVFSNVVTLFALYLADGDDEHREDEDCQGHPGHVGFEAPGLCKVPPTLVHPRSHLRAGEDENLEAGRSGRLLLIRGGARSKPDIFPAVGA